MFKKSKKVVKKVEKKIIVESIRPEVENDKVQGVPEKKVKKSFDVYNGKEIVRTFKKESVAKSWAKERGFKLK